RAELPTIDLRCCGGVLLRFEGIQQRPMLVTSGLELAFWAGQCGELRLQARVRESNLTRVGVQIERAAGIAVVHGVVAVIDSDVDPMLLQHSGTGESPGTRSDDGDMRGVGVHDDLPGCSGVALGKSWRPDESSEVVHHARKAHSI